MLQSTMPRVKNRIAVIAHRGGARIFPEDTLLAFRRAISLGCDYVEIDVRTTRDGKIVVIHDRRVDHTTNGTREVRQLTLKQIRQLDAGVKFSPLYRGERVPTLEEVFEVCRGKVNVYIDLKDASPEAIIPIIRRYQMERQVLIFGKMEALKEWKQKAPYLPVMMSLPKPYRRPGGIAELKKELPLDAINGDMDLWNSDLVKEAQNEGLTVYVDNLGKPDTLEGYRQSISMEVQGTETDYPDALLRLIRSL